MNPRSPKFFAVLMAFVLIVPLFLVPSGAAPTAEAKMGDVQSASDAFTYKIHPQLRATAAASAASDEIGVMVHAVAGSDLSAYLKPLLVRPYVSPNGTQAYFGKIRAGAVGKVASLPTVAYVQEMKSVAEAPAAADPDLAQAKPDIEALRATLAAARAGQLKPTVERAPADLASIADWFDVLDVHKSKAAWNLGYTGVGVKVMVNDSGIDFAHPDLQGTQARVTNPASPYYGWPMAFDSYSMLNLAYDYYLGTTFIKDGVGIGGAAPDYADTSTTRSGGELTDNGDGTYSAIFAPIGSTAPGGHIYKFKPTSKSGVYHFGSHPDLLLARLLKERAAVLVVDEHTAGVYDTVYADIDGDYDFTNEKKAVKGDEIIFQDLNGDGYADLSGGMIYWISDGVNSLPVSGWLWGIGPDVAGPGNLVAFVVMDSTEGGGNHGQLCASAVAAQGIIDGNAPAFKPVGDGTPFTGMVQGGGRNVKLVASGNFYVSVDQNEGFLFAALGYDGRAGTDDDVQIISNSWGQGAIDNDGWDYYSRAADAVLRYINPTLTDSNSAGNGAAGYGTVTSPGESLQLSVAASTLYDSDNIFDSITGVNQIQYNDIQPWSNRGPTAVGDNGVSVAANGAWGAGDAELNAVLNGWRAWTNWGGTSRSAPIAAGNLGLVYGAFKDKYGRWPTNVEARAILMAGADNASYDGFVQGSGTVNAERAVKIAAGLDGIFATPESWTFGSYRGVEYDSFTKILHPGQSATKTFTVYNGGATAKTVAISDDRLNKIGSTEWEFTSLDRTKESPYQHRKPDYLFDITKKIPAGTDLVEAKVVFPFDQFDPEGDYRQNNSWRVLIYDWTDVNGDGALWTDKNGDGAVTCPVASGLPNYNDPTCEIQKGEYMRFSYGYNMGTALQTRVKKPLERKHDGIFLGLLHRDRAISGQQIVPITNAKIQLNFYKTADFGWLTTDSSVTVPAGGMATFNATMSVPALAGIGMYNGFIRLNDGVNVTSIPVVANVAAFSADFLFGGPPDATTPYDNGQVYGYFDWAWRAESGDWRFYFVDVPDGTAAGTSLLVDNRWTGARSDIDTVIMGPTKDCFSNGVGCAWPFGRFPGDPTTYGPYTLAPVGGSSRNYMGSGKWMRQTSTGGPREIVAATAAPGLNLVALQNVSYNGTMTAERFQGQVGTITAMPPAVDLFVGMAPTGTFPVQIRSSLPLAGLTVDAFGLGLPEKHLGLPQIQDNPNDVSTSSYRFPVTISHGAKLEATTTSAAGDIDLFLLYDFNGDGQFSYPSEAVGSSTTSTADEFISLKMPRDGNYQVWVHGWATAATPFDLVINAVQGNDMTVAGLPAGPFQPHQVIAFNVNWTKTIAEGEAAEGLILAGPPGAPGALQIPVRLHNITTGTATKTVGAAADSTINVNYPTTNYGTEYFLYTGAGDMARSVVRFDTSSIASMYPVVSAKARFYVTGFGSTGAPHSLKAYGLNTNFAESTVTWVTPWTTPGGDFGATALGSAPISMDLVGTWVEFDVTNLAKHWVWHPWMNQGLALRALDGVAYSWFSLASRNYWDATKRPELIVTYRVP